MEIESDRVIEEWVVTSATIVQRKLYEVRTFPLKSPLPVLPQFEIGHTRKVLDLIGDILDVVLDRLGL
jgi:hypothetical protein